MRKKKCSRCGEEKPLDTFHRNKRLKDGRARWCKSCANEKTADWRKRNPSYKQEWNANNRERIATHRKRWEAENKERLRALNRQSRARHPETQTARSRRYRAANPEKARAHNLVNLAVFHGKLQKPEKCSHCGKKTVSQLLHAHHEDYSRPLVVEWLCLWCHRQRHT